MKFCNSSHSTAISLVFSWYGFAKNMLPFFSTMRGPPVAWFHNPKIHIVQNPQDSAVSTYDPHLVRIHLVRKIFCTIFRTK